MQITLSTDPLAAIDTDWLVVPVFESSEFSHHVDVLNTALGGLLADLRERGDLTGKLAEIVTLPVAPGIAAERVLTIGLGPAGSLGVESLERALLTAIRQVSSHKDQRIAVALPPMPPPPSRPSCWRRSSPPTWSWVPADRDCTRPKQAASPSPRPSSPHPEVPTARTNSSRPSSGAK